MEIRFGLVCVAHSGDDWRFRIKFTLISLNDLMITSALLRSWTPEFGFKKPIHLMPAAFAATMPFFESSMTRHSLGEQLISSAVFKKIPGCGLECGSSAPLTVVKKKPDKLNFSRTAAIISGTDEEATAILKLFSYSPFIKALMPGMGVNSLLCPSISK